MSKIAWIKGISAAALCVFTLYSGISHAGIAGSKHDLSDAGDSGFQYRTDQVCVFCHTPHGANKNNEAMPGTIWNSTGYTTAAGGQGAPMLLWNRSLAVLNSPAEYQLYQSSTMVTNPTEVRIYSLLCMSCHDGVSALNVLFNYPGSRKVPILGAGAPSGWRFRIGAVFTNSGPNIGERTETDATEDVNLSNDHPVSFDYPADGADAGLELFSVANATDLKFYRNPHNPSQVRSIECPTCHDVHEYDESGTGDQEPFLRVSMEDSGMCTSCHRK